jgi:hypothetical protein
MSKQTQLDLLEAFEAFYPLQAEFSQLEAAANTATFVADVKNIRSKYGKESVVFKLFSEEDLAISMEGFIETVIETVKKFFAWLGEIVKKFINNFTVIGREDNRLAEIAEKTEVSLPSFNEVKLRLEGCLKIVGNLKNSYEATISSGNPVEEAKDRIARMLAMADWNINEQKPTPFSNKKQTLKELGWTPENHDSLKTLMDSCKHHYDEVLTCTDKICQKLNGKDKTEEINKLISAVNLLNKMTTDVAKAIGEGTTAAKVVYTHYSSN